MLVLGLLRFLWVLPNFILGNFSLFAMLKLLCLFQLVCFWSRINTIYTIALQRGKIPVSENHFWVNNSCVFFNHSPNVKHSLFNLSRVFFSLLDNKKSNVNNFVDLKSRFSLLSRWVHNFWWREVPLSNHWYKESISCKPSCLQAYMHPPKGKRKESAMSNKEREGSTKGKGGFYKKLQNYKTAKLVYYQMKYGLLLYFYDSQGYYG